MNATFTQGLEALGAFESGKPSGDPQQYKVQNTLGFTGKYQFGEALLIDLGYYKADTFYGAGAATNLWQGIWTDKAQQFGVNSIEDFKNSPDIQEAAIRDAFAFNWNIIETSLGYQGKSIADYLGQTKTFIDGGQPKTVTITEFGILAGAHLRGPYGLANLLLNDEVSYDEYGTSILRYVDEYAGYEAPDAITGGISPLPGPTNPAPIPPTNPESPVNPAPPIPPGDPDPTADLNGVDGQQDVFDFTWNWGASTTIANFNPSEDAIDLRPFWFSDRNSVEVRPDGNGNTVISVPSNMQTIQLQGIDASQLNDNNLLVTRDSSPSTPPATPPPPPVDPMPTPIDPPPVAPTPIAPMPPADQLIEGTPGQDQLNGTDGADQIFGYASKDIIQARAGNDTVRGGKGNDEIYGGAGDDQIDGQKGRDLIKGGAGSDRISGGDGDDRLIGVDNKAATPGKNEIDRLEGGSGKDIFVLGNKDKVFYNDGVDNTIGAQDYALIQDFDAAGDTIKLHGQASDYRLRNLSSAQGQEIYLKTPGRDELIARIQGQVENLNLTSEAFRYVSSNTPTPVPTSSPVPTPSPTPTNGQIIQVNENAADVLNFDSAMDKIDFGNYSVHSMIITESSAGVSFRSPWNSSAQTLVGISLKDLSADNFLPIGNQHLREDVGGALAWSTGKAILKPNTVYARSHEVGKREVVDFNPTTDKISFLYYGSRELLNIADSSEGVVFSNGATNQSLVLKDVRIADLAASNFEFHFSQVREDHLDNQLGFTVGSNQIVSRDGIATPGHVAGPGTPHHHHPMANANEAAAIDPLLGYSGHSLNQTQAEESRRPDQLSLPFPHDQVGITAVDPPFELEGTADYAMLGAAGNSSEMLNGSTNGALSGLTTAGQNGPDKVSELHAQILTGHLTV